MNRAALSVSLAFISTVLAQSPARRPVGLQSPVQDKNFYVLSLIQRTPAVAKAVSEESTLKKILEQKTWSP